MLVHIQKAILTVCPRVLKYAADVFILTQIIVINIVTLPHVSLTQDLSLSCLCFQPFPAFFVVELCAFETFCFCHDTKLSRGA